MANKTIDDLTPDTPVLTDQMELQHAAAGASFKATVDDILALAGGTPGGSNTQVQFNDSTAFGGSAGFLYDKTLSHVAIGAGTGFVSGTALTVVDTVTSSGGEDRYGILSVVTDDGAPASMAGANLSALFNGAGTVPEVSGFFSNIANGGAGTITEGIGVHIGSNAALGGAITINYGLKVDDQTTGGTNYAIKTGLGKVDFGDNVTLTAPTGVLPSISATGADASVPLKLGYKGDQGFIQAGPDTIGASGWSGSDVNLEILDNASRTDDSYGVYVEKYAKDVNGAFVATLNFLAGSQAAAVNGSANIYGINGQASSYAPTGITNSSAVAADFATRQQGAGALTEADCVRSEIFATTGNIVTGYGLRAKNGTLASGGTITTLYGLKVDDQTVGGTNYSCHFGTGLYHFDALTASSVVLTNASKNLTSVALAGDTTKFLNESGVFSIPAGSGGGTVTHTGALTANEIVLGNGTDDIKVTATGTGIVTALGVNVGSAGAPVLFNGAGGTPTSLVGTNITGSATGLTAGITNALKSASTTVDVSAATAPTSGQVLTATGGTAATWQTPGGGSGTVTHTAGALTANALVLGNGAADITVMASLGTTTTVLHGNAAGAPTFGAVNLATDTTGALPVVINAQTGTTYTVLSSDQGKLVTLSNGSAIAVTLPQATGSFAANWATTLLNLGAGTVTITPTTSTVNGGATVVLTTGQSYSPVSDGTNYSGPYGSLGAGSGANAALSNLASVAINTALVLGSSDGAALGSTTKQWSDLFLAEGGVINWDNGDATITQTNNDITIAGITTFGVGTGTAVTLGTIELGAASDTTLSRSAAGVLAVEGVNVMSTAGENVIAAGSTNNLALPTVDGTATGNITNAFNSGYSSSAVGDLVYLDSSATWQKCDANTLALYNGLLGIALEVKASGNALRVALPGSFVYATAFPTFTIGGPVYMSETAGAVTQTAPTTTDAATRVVGWGFHADKLYFFPSPDYITHT